MPLWFPGLRRDYPARTSPRYGLYRRGQTVRKTYVLGRQTYYQPKLDDLERLLTPDQVKNVPFNISEESELVGTAVDRLENLHAA